MQNRLFILIAGLIVFSCPILDAAETSSENAANLYIKCIQRLKKPDASTWKQIEDISPTTPPTMLSPEVIAFLEEQRKNSLIADIEAASKVKNCDWKLDYSKGFEMQIPYLGDMKELAKLLRADSLLAVTQKDCETAINKNLAIWRMGYHCKGKTTVEYLVSNYLITMSETGVQQTLGMCTVKDVDLTSLKAELLSDTYRPQSFKNFILSEKQAMRLMFSNVKFSMFENLLPKGQTGGFEHFIVPEFIKKHKELIRGQFKVDDPNTPNPAWIAASIQYMGNYYASILTAIDKPYPIAVEEMKKAIEKVKKEAETGNEVAFLNALFLSPKDGMYSVSTRFSTQYNALLTALDIYTTIQQLKMLPEEIPNNSYVDYFSGKPFLYEKTQNGFKLCCRQEDIIMQKPWEWEYTVKKP